MDNASKNAGEMIGKFSLLYNRSVLLAFCLTLELVKLSSPLSSLISSLELAQFSGYKYLD